MTTGEMTASGIWLALGAAILGLWWRPVRGMVTVGWMQPWCWLSAAALALAWWHGTMKWQALVALGAYGALVAWLRLSPRSRAAPWCLGLMALALALHAVPGFQRALLIDAVRLRADALPFTLYANLDKALAGLGLIVAACSLASTRADWRQVGRGLLLFWPLTTALVLALGVALHVVRFEPRLVPQAPLFLAVNLLFTCVAEEAFFRGLLQTWLQRAMGKGVVAAWLPVLVSAAAFGLAHLGGGRLFALVAGVAGLGYALAYARTGRIEVAILTHFGVNAVHFLLFTYPMLA